MNHFPRAVGAFALLVGLVSSVAVHAVDRFRIADVTLPTESTGNVISILGDLDEDILGFSVSLDFDRSKLRITNVELRAAVVGQDPDYVNGRVDNSNGNMVQGVVLALQEDHLDRRIPAGNGRELLKITVDVVTASESTTILNLNNVSGNPGRRNVMTDTSGRSVSPIPTLDDGRVTLESRAIEIQSIAQNMGEAGDVFLIVGQNFTEPGLSVRVCDAAAQFELLADNQTLQVTAPPCPETGWAEVEVCNDFGCDSDNEGFFYEEADEKIPVIQSVDFNTGVAGDSFFVVGLNFGEPGLTVTICGETPVFALLVDGQTIVVTAPTCGMTGWQAVEVCNENGCATEPNGFHYDQAGTEFLRGDANNDGNVDLSDGVAILNHLFLGVTAPAPCEDALDSNDSGDLDLSDGIAVLNFLFQGGGPPPEPYPNRGLDPTADGLADC